MFPKLIKKNDKTKLYTHNLAAAIVDDFENVLDENNITIPDNSRTGEKDEARIFGETYDKLLYTIEIRMIALLSAYADESKYKIVSEVFE